MGLFFFFKDTATTEIYTLHIVGSVRCVQETGINAEYMGDEEEFRVRPDVDPGKDEDGGRQDQGNDERRKITCREEAEDDGAKAGCEFHPRVRLAQAVLLGHVLQQFLKHRSLVCLCLGQAFLLANPVPEHAANENAPDCSLEGKEAGLDLTAWRLPLGDYGGETLHGFSRQLGYQARSHVIGTGKLCAFHGRTRVQEKPAEDQDCHKREDLEPVILRHQASPRALLI
eukprot:TRINITY_DN9734_c0_g1_i1.p2 TRINITY_DN9734_c0_g1~~TRINITY_DN9734_c0_g1_i1.p2  ORF type:complete len:228 (+),score=18.24 TRINITY_DN9734_c0_g1_i1:63-746(+)